MITGFSRLSPAGAQPWQPAGFSPPRNSLGSFGAGLRELRAAAPSASPPAGRSATARTRLAFSTPRTAAHTRSAAASAAAGPNAHHTHDPHPPAPAPSTPSPTPNSTEGDAVNLGWYTPIQAPLPLESLYEAMRQIGLSPSDFQFQQLEAYLPFPTRPDLDFVSRQVLIQGRNGRRALFDLDLALRTPWVAAQELRSNGLG